MKVLNLPAYQFRLREEDNKPKIFDRWRKKFVALTPEEWVRQNFLTYLVTEKGFPESRITVEAGLKVGKRNKRTDAVIYNRKGKPLVIIECKAPEVNINKDVFDQIVRYNITLEVNYLMVTNGLTHFCCQLDYINNNYHFFEKIPDYETLA